MAKVPMVPMQPQGFDMATIKATRETLSLRKYQEKHLGMFIENPRFADLSEAGVGKTPPACLYIYWLWKALGIKTIFSMPKSLLVKNYEELLLWSEFEIEDVVILRGSPANRERQIVSPAKVFLCAHDTFANNWEDIVAAHPQVKALVADEWHLGFSTHGEVFYRGKNPTPIYSGTARTAKMYKFLKQTKGRLLAMTGTLVKGRLCSAYPLINVINPLYYGTYDKFMLTHALLDDYGKPYMWLEHKRLAEILKRHSCSMTFSEAYGKENKQIFIELCTMSDKQRKAYSDMEENALLELEDSFLEGKTPALAVLRCRQIMQAPEMYDLPHGEDGKDAHIEEHIQRALDEGTPLVIFETTKIAQVRINQMAIKMGARSVLLNGDTPGSRRSQYDEMMRRGDLDVLVAAPIVAGVGFNWANVSHMVFSAIDYGDDTFIQNYRRALRGKRATPLKIYILQYRRSIDQRIAAIVNQKSRDRLLVMGEKDTQVHLTRKAVDGVIGAYVDGDINEY